MTSVQFELAKKYAGTLGFAPLGAGNATTRCTTASEHASEIIPLACAIASSDALVDARRIEL